MNMALSLSAATTKKVQPFVNFQGTNSFNMEQFFRRKEKVVVVMGATGTGKSRLAIDLATHFPAEIINSDKIQLHKGLDIVTNKVTDEECHGITHHLMSIIDPNSNFSSTDFSHLASRTIESILDRDRIPIIAGGSNSFVEALINDRAANFQFRYDCCFLWVDASFPVLQDFVSARVDRMVNAGFIEEVREMFDLKADYSRGIRRAIGVPELHDYLRAERDGADERILYELLELAISKIKDNTCKLALRQLQKIHRLRNEWNWNLRRLDATEAILGRGENQNSDKAWRMSVVEPSLMIVDQFLNSHNRVTTIISPDSVSRTSHSHSHSHSHTQVPLAVVAASR